ncbi:hypothetical protein F5B18DRAFT_652405 [Nemania serpens]|nr:hypothetical protein F5B18DRAFT_652405 [Nemania serpens]
MADRFQLDLKTIEISGQIFDLSLSMTSVAFIYNVPLRNITQSGLSSLILSKQLWLLPCGVSRLDVHVPLGECDIWREQQGDFFEFVGHTICQSSLWSQLGLKIEILDVQYHQEGDNMPNLYFSIEQPDMSSALLSPPHTNTAHFKGLECILRFKSPTRSEATFRGEEQADHDVPLWSSDQIISSAVTPASHYPLDTRSEVEAWEQAAYLIEAALCITFGTRKLMRGLTIFELEKAPSLLDLAPAIWNSRYLKSTVKHTKNFAVISNILASSLNGQSPQLRRKGAEILRDNANIDPNQELGHSTKQLESSIQRMLWDLLQSILKPTVGTTRASRKATSAAAELYHQDDEVDEILVDEEASEQFDLPDWHYYPDEDLCLPLSQDYADYQSIGGCDPDMEFAWQHVDDSSLFLQNEQEPLSPEFDDGTGYFFHEPDTSGCEPLGSNIEYSESDLCHKMKDHVMSDYIYEKSDDIYGYENDVMDVTGQGLTGYELAAAPCFPWENQDDAYRAVIEESPYDLEIDEDLFRVMLSKSDCWVERSSESE